MTAHLDCARVLRPTEVDRRAAIRCGLLGAGGLMLADLLRAEAQASPDAPKKRPTSVIVLHMRGGPSQLETRPRSPAFSSVNCCR